MRAVVLFSGGQDSTTCLFWAIREYGREDVIALSFDYGQRHRVELDRAREIARAARVDHRIQPLGRLAPSALTSSEAIAVDKTTGLPTTFVPGRNIVFLSYAGGVAYAHGAGHVIIGANAIDYSGYPDCRPETIQATERVLRLALAWPDFQIIAPLVDRTKAQIVRLACELGDECWAAIGRSWTCYDPQSYRCGVVHSVAHTKYDDAAWQVDYRPCGVCPACVLRAKGFADADERDPAL